MASGDSPEEYLLENGEGLIDVRGVDFDCGLLVGGEPVAFYWSDCEGSVAQYLVRSRDTRNLSERLRILRHVAGGGFDPAAPLAPQIHPLLALFTNAKYQLTYTDALGPHDVLSYDSRFSYAADRDSFYPSTEELITTQRSDTLRRERIAFFRERIAAGVRPVVFAAGTSGCWASFILHGHHKLQAYRESGISPAVLFIYKQTPDPIPLEDGVRLLGEAQRYKKDYSRVKRDHGGIVTEADWLNCTKPWELVSFIQDRASVRKRRLFACVCCRQVWSHLGHNLKRAVEVSERFADGLASGEELSAVRRLADLDRQQGSTSRGRAAAIRAMAAAACGDVPGYAGAFSLKSHDEVLLIRDIFGNPFRPVVIVDAWLAWNGALIPRLAQTVYDECSLPAGLLDVTRIAVLADALEDSGCTTAAILDHLRGPGPHVRGCHVVDLLQTKE